MSSVVCVRNRAGSEFGGFASQTLAEPAQNCTPVCDGKCKLHLGKSQLMKRGCGAYYNMQLANLSELHESGLKIVQGIVYYAGA